VDHLNESDESRGLRALGDVARLVVERIGGGALNGVFKRHTGIEDVDVAGTIGMAGDILVPAVKEAYSAQPDEPFFDTLQRRVVWTVGIAGVVALAAGGGYLVWTWLKKPVGDQDEGED
jgi:hypothetical protein